VALATGMLWTKSLPYNLRAAALCVGSIMVSPYVLYYDLCILSIAVAFLVKEELSRGFLPGQRTALLLCWAALFLVKTPIGAVVCAVLGFLCVRRIMVYRRNHLTAPHDGQLGGAVSASPYRSVLGYVPRWRCHADDIGIVDVRDK
jgi:hypothetical protein